MIDPRTVWAAIDKIAEAHGGLTRVCRASELSISTLNKSRRETAWPSLKTVAKILDAYNMTLKDFSNLIEKSQKT